MAWLISKAMMKECANSPSLQARVAEYLEESSSDGGQSAPSSGTPTQQAFLWQGKTTAAWKRFPSGMMCRPLKEDLGEDLLMWYREDFLVRISPPQAKEPESTESEAECGATWPASLARFDPASSSWRTHQCSLFGGLEEFSGIWPRWGMMRDGELYQLQNAMLHMKEKEFGSMQYYTPTARDWKGMSGKGFRERHGSVKNLADFLGGVPNPMFSEWLMGWPIEWTDLKPLGMDKFQLWLQQHGGFSNE